MVDKVNMLDRVDRFEKVMIDFIVESVLAVKN